MEKEEKGMSSKFTGKLDVKEPFNLKRLLSLRSPKTHINYMVILPSCDLLTLNQAVAVVAHWAQAWDETGSNRCFLRFA